MVIGAGELFFRPSAERHMFTLEKKRTNQVHDLHDWISQSPERHTRKLSRHPKVHHFWSEGYEEEKLTYFNALNTLDDEG
jgi:hypothetical protein